MEQAGAFRRMAAALVKRSGSGKGLCLVLVMLCFFSSMLVTNDVALITFVPFAVLVLAASGQGGLLPWVVSLQTVAANLGSMLTPVGNPQNLYLYSRYGFPRANSSLSPCPPRWQALWCLWCCACSPRPVGSP